MRVPTILPYLLSLVVSGGLLLVALLLCFVAWRGRNTRDIAPADLSSDPGVYGPTYTNRWLRVLRSGFVLACIFVLGFHGYWVFGAPGDDEYNRFAMRDQRNRRLSEAGLKGWVFDRTGKVDRALVKYRLDGDKIVREYPLRDAAVNLTGYTDFIYGSAGIERAYVDYLTVPESTYNALYSPAPVGRDVTTTIDADLQREAYALLKGRRGAAVVLSVPDCEVLAMVSSPSYDPMIVLNEQAWKELNEHAVSAPALSPMTDRALKTYYLPGSTFKVLVALAAIESGLENEQFTCKGEGFVAPQSSRPILDDSNSVHGTINLKTALQKSCNQYFAQMGLKIGPQRLADVARRFGIDTGPPGPARDKDLWRFKVADPTDFVAAFAPPPARVYLPGGFEQDFGPYDLAIESFGQGPNQMTILQLALIAAGVAGDGQLMKPTLESGVEAQPIGRVCAPETAAMVRDMMRAVVESGTAAQAFAPLRGKIGAGGKTGTAQREVIVYDPKTFKPKTVKTREGKDAVVRDTSIDALFLGFAPYDKPQIAFAMIVEDGGHGGTAAAPIAVGLIQKAAQLGLIQATPAAAPARGAGDDRRPARPTQPRRR